MAVQMDLGTLIVEVEQIAPNTVLYRRVVSRKRGYRKPNNGLSRHGFTFSVATAPQLPVRIGIGTDSGEVITKTGNFPELATV